MAVQVQWRRAESTDLVGWDDWVCSIPSEGGLCQSAFWGRVMRRVEGADAIYLTVTDRGGVVGRLALMHRRPYDRHARRSVGRLRAWFHGLCEALEWVDGPVIAKPAQAGNVTDHLLTWVDEFAWKQSVGKIVSQGMARCSRLLESKEIRDAFARHGYLESRWGSLLVDLSLEEEKLWGNLDHAARKCVKKCVKRGIRVRRISDFDDFARNFYEPYTAIQRKLGHDANPLYVSRVVFEEDIKGYYAYFVAEGSDGQVLGMLGMYMFNGIATEIVSGLTPEARVRDIPAQDILHWEMMRYAKAQGCEVFDLAGVAPTPHNEKEAGIRRFKEKWGGRYVEYYRFEKVMPRWQAWLAIRSCASRLCWPINERLAVRK